MKKILILFILILTFIANANEYEYFCSQNSSSKTISGFIASTSGFNLLSRNIVENIIEKTIKKETGAKFKIKIDNFYSTNILNGEFKNLNATAKKYEHDGIYLSNININTLCKYNKIFFEKENLYFEENMVLKFNGNLTNEQLKKTIDSEKLNKNLAKILTKILKNKTFISLANAFFPITLQIKIDENNKAQLKITKIDTINENFTFESYILIPKNK